VPAQTRIVRRLVGRYSAARVTLRKEGIRAGRRAATPPDNCTRSEGAPVSDAGRHAAAPNRARSVSRRTAAAVVTVVVSLAALMAGCGDGGAGNGTTATTSTANTTSTTTSDPDTAERQAVIDAYLAAEEAAAAASAAPLPNPEHPDLLATHTGPMLDQRQEAVSGLRANGWAIRLPEGSKYREEVESVEFEENDVAILKVCVVDDGERFDVETGEVIASGLATGAVTAAMRRVDGAWMLAERREDRQWEGEAGCAVD
jgi:hypothetical protein